MDLDDEVCLCFHVTKRKVLNYLRVEQPRRAAELAHCFGAGTGCGWCRVTLQRYFDNAQVATPSGDEPSVDEYSRARGRYLKSGGGTPPTGATPPPDET